MYPAVPGVYVVSHVAKKPHKCEYKGSECDGTIRPGERYVDEVVSPWTPIADDVDDEGRTIGHPSGEWTHMRYHQQCMDESVYGWTRL